VRCGKRGVFSGAEKRVGGIQKTQGESPHRGGLLLGGGCVEGPLLWNKKWARVAETSGEGVEKKRKPIGGAPYHWKGPRGGGGKTWKEGQRRYIT